MKLLCDKLQELSQNVETQKLKALGEKSKLENAAENKNKKIQLLLQKINQKKIELENQQNEYQSLSKIISD